MLDNTHQPAQRQHSTISVRAESLDSEAPLEDVRLSEVREGNEIRIVSNVNSLDGKGFDTFDALEKLQQRLFKVGVHLYCCGNCRFLQLTGKSRQMSFGAKGYCLRYCREQGRSREDIVSIYDSCGEFIFGSQSFIHEIQAAWQAQRRNVEGLQQEDTDHGST